MVILSHLVNVSEGLLAHGVSIAAEGTSSSASPTPAVSANTTAGSWAEAFPPKLENAILQAMKQKLVHLKLPIGTDSCGPFSFYSVGEFGP